MEIQITLDKHSGRLSKREPFLLAENEDVLISVKSNISLKNVIINFKNGDDMAQTKLEDCRCVVPKKVVKPGVLDCEVNLCARGNIVKTYIVEPIVLYSVPPNFEGHPEFDLLKIKVAKFIALVNELLELKDQVSALENRVAELEAKNEE
ncbi:MAG: hypothetical protein ACI4MZ_01350 [Christensenellales bacterium]